MGLLNCLETFLLEAFMKMQNPALSHPCSDKITTGNEISRDVANGWLVFSATNKSGLLGSAHMKVSLRRFRS